MKQGRARKIVFVCMILLAIFFLSFYIYLNFYKEEISADVVTQSDIKTIDISQPDPDSRSEVAIPILMYHHIRDYDKEDDLIGTNLSVSLNRFTEQLNYLSDNGYTTIDFSQLARFPNQAIPEKPIILTFDDGYDDNFQAYEILKSKNMTGVFYIIYNYLERNGHLKRQQVVDISKNGMEIGSHTMNHLDLTKLTESDLLYELSDSKTLLEGLINDTVISLCYPSGKYDNVVVEKAKSAGYENAVTTNPGIATTSDDRFRLKRIRVSHNDSLQTFSSKLESK